MKTNILLLLFSIGSVVSSAKQTTELTVKTKEFTYYFSVSESVPEIRMNDIRTYYWYQENMLSSSQGGYHGRLLHDQYVVKGRDGTLLTKGAFVNGLKEGVWKEWGENGELKTVSRFNNGHLIGKHREYERGRLIAERSYSRGTLHGKTVTYDEKGVPTTVNYKRGSLVHEPLDLEEKSKKSGKRHDETSERRPVFRDLFTPKANKKMMRSAKKKIRKERKEARKRKKEEEVLLKESQMEKTVKEESKPRKDNTRRTKKAEDRH